MTPRELAEDILGDDWHPLAYEKVEAKIAAAKAGWEREARDEGWKLGEEYQRRISLAAQPQPAPSAGVGLATADKVKDVLPTDSLITEWARANGQDAFVLGHTLILVDLERWILARAYRSNADVVTDIMYCAQIRDLSLRAEDAENDVIKIENDFYLMKARAEAAEARYIEATEGWQKSIEGKMEIVSEVDALRAEVEGLRTKLELEKDARANDLMEWRGIGEVIAENALLRAEVEGLRAGIGDALTTLGHDIGMVNKINYTTSSLRALLRATPGEGVKP